MNDTVFLIIAGIFGAIIVFAIVYFITSSSRKKKLGVIGMVTNNKGLTQGKLTEFLPNFDNNRFSKNVFREAKMYFSSFFISPSLIFTKQR